MQRRLQPGVLHFCDPASVPACSFAGPFACVYVSQCMCVCARACVYICVREYARGSVSMCMCVHMCMCRCMCLCACVSVHVSMCLCDFASFCFRECVSDFCSLLCVQFCVSGMFLHAYAVHWSAGVCRSEWQPPTSHFVTISRLCPNPTSVHSAVGSHGQIQASDARCNFVDGVMAINDPVASPRRADRGMIIWSSFESGGSLDRLLSAIFS